ncbi:hypothetical protein NEUTE1DRAFT_96118 [Neurospora tetrasperma FGSC 2508]|uniref:Uncharacterized protein n=1 Tax=Neurospora tetrasperma (strain FGSC 2508 / ATCC MYA-4615 / P0657) TaxID=510951 RepID=F8MXM4_NEUT8|nr:uncharacterized protein NEUTE1DRAFT_96118 [Neurospora tetrasperma FGSC 2508]EGO54495.1 hypothetical protein NEUTE1DRAFT_96118 [Neurospora tetrasperma FGSC 2508]EGZ68053.1 hypothetical protein NEUTE2DRAFT_122490 [Neurospora tetrasperma FGSC 2509]
MGMESMVFLAGCIELCASPSPTRPTTTLLTNKLEDPPYKISSVVPSYYCMARTSSSNRFRTATACSVKISLSDGRNDRTVASGW